MCSSSCMSVEMPSASFGVVEYNIQLSSPAAFLPFPEEPIPSHKRWGLAVWTVALRTWFPIDSSRPGRSGGQMSLFSDSPRPCSPQLVPGTVAAHLREALHCRHTLPSPDHVGVSDEDGGEEEKGAG